MLNRLVLSLALSLALVSTGGCSSGRSIATDRAFDGPPITVRPLDEHQLLVVEAPTPGWTMRIDHIQRKLDHADVFVTMQRPDPGVLYAQVIVEQQLLTNVTLSRPVNVYARTLAFGQTRKKPPYRLAAKSELPE